MSNINECVVLMRLSLSDGSLLSGVLPGERVGFLRVGGRV
jgi:hypothetical protein